MQLDLTSGWNGVSGQGQDSLLCMKPFIQATNLTLLKSFLKHHLGATAPENPEVEALRLEVAEMKEKYEAVLEENRKLKAKVNAESVLGWEGDPFLSYAVAWMAGMGTWASNSPLALFQTCRQHRPCNYLLLQ